MLTLVRLTLALPCQPLVVYTGGPISSLPLLHGTLCASLSATVILLVWLVVYVPSTVGVPNYHQRKRLLD